LGCIRNRAAPDCRGFDAAAAGADALQLAAAYLAAEQRPPSLEMITLDDRLASAAKKEGFAVIDIARD
jgi:hypothetical protein